MDRQTQPGDVAITAEMLEDSKRIRDKAFRDDERRKNAEDSAMTDGNKPVVLSQWLINELTMLATREKTLWGWFNARQSELSTQIVGAPRSVPPQWRTERVNMDKNEREIAIARLDLLTRPDRERDKDQEVFFATVLKALMDDLHRRQTREES